MAFGQEEVERRRQQREALREKREQEQQRLGRKFHQSDENFLHDAQRLIAGEIAAVMDISFAEALEKLRNTLQ